MCLTSYYYVGDSVYLLNYLEVGRNNFQTYYFRIKTTQKLLTKRAQKQKKSKICEKIL